MGFAGLGRRRFESHFEFVQQRLVKIVAAA